MFGRGWTIENHTLEEHIAKVAKVQQYGSHVEIKAAASLCQTSIYVATDSLIMGKCIWTAFPPFPAAKLNKLDTGKDFVSQPKPWYEIAYSSGCHYDGILPIRSDCPLSPPPLARDTNQQTITV